MAAVRNRALYFVLWFLLLSSSSFFPSFFLSYFSAVEDWMFTILPHMMWLSANLECRSEMCCTRLAGNKVKVKSTLPHEECWWGAHLP